MLDEGDEEGMPVEDLPPPEIVEPEGFEIREGC